MEMKTEVLAATRRVKATAPSHSPCSPQHSRRQGARAIRWRQTLVIVGVIVAIAAL
jgi:hypothetical protein